MRRKAIHQHIPFKIQGKAGKHSSLIASLAYFGQILSNVAIYIPLSAEAGVRDTKESKKKEEQQSMVAADMEQEDSFIYTASLYQNEMAFSEKLGVDQSLHIPKPTSSHSVPTINYYINYHDRVNDEIVPLKKSNDTSLSNIKIADETGTRMGTGTGKKSSLLQKASGGDAYITNNAQHKVMNLFQDVDTCSAASTRPSSHIMQSNAKGKENEVNPPQLAGGRKSSILQKASGGEVFISLSARSKANSFINSFDNGVKYCEAKPAFSSSSNAPPLATQNSNHLNSLNLGFLHNHVQQASSSSSDYMLTSDGSGSSGGGGRKSSLLQKASGGAVFIADESRRKAEQFVSSSSAKSIDAPNISIAPTSSSSAPTAPGGVRKSSLLQSAGGKDVFISDQARNKAQDFMNKSSNDQILTNSTNSPLSQSSMPPPTGLANTVRKSTLLQSASGKDVLISDAARKKADAFMSKENSADLPCPAPLSSVAPTMQSGGRKSSLLQKASGRGVIISDNAHQKAQKFLTSSDVSSSSSFLYADSNALSPHISNNRPRQAYSINSAEKPIERPASSVKSVTFAALPQYFNEINSDLYKSTQDFLSLPSPHYSPPRPFTLFTPALDRESLLAEEFELIIPSVDFNEAYLQYLQHFSSGNLKDFTIQSGAETLTISSILQIAKDKLNLSTSIEPKDSAWLHKQCLWVLWTFISYERTYPLLYAKKLLNKDALVNALLYRYSLYNRLPLANTSSSVMNSSLPVTGQYKSAIMHFNKRGAMSPLQRCEEIRTWIGPMCLCLAVAKSNSSNLNGGNSGSSWSMQVTDGWWWVKVSADPHIYSLINKGLIADGYKVIIFAASFSPSDNSEAPMHLQINGIRKAHKSKRLGYINPTKLRRGLCLSTLKEDGGPVYAMTFAVIRKFPVIYKLRVPSKTHTGEEGGMQTVVLSRRDAELVCALLEDVREMALNRAEQGTRSTRKRKNDQGSSSGVDTISPEDIEQILSQAKEYFDLLVECSTSKKLFWLRVPSHGEEGDRSVQSLREGATATASNLSILRNYSLCHSGLTLAVTRNSNLSVEKREGTVEIIPPDPEKIQLYIGGRMMEIASAEELFQMDSWSTFHKGEMVCSMRVVDWYGEEEEERDGSPFDPISLSIFGLLASKHCVMLRYTVLRGMVKKLGWLKRGAGVRLCLGGLQGVDPPNGVLHCVAGDHTCLSPLSSPASVRTPASSRGGAGAGAGTGGKSPKKARVVTPAPPSKGRFQTPARSASASKSSTLEDEDGDVAEEVARLAALRRTEQFYTSTLLPGLSLSCTRFFWPLCSVEEIKVASNVEQKVVFVEHLGERKIALLTGGLEVTAAPSSLCSLCVLHSLPSPFEAELRETGEKIQAEFAIVSMRK